eukprot:10805862-Karenia_brevis.AAC.1
MGQQEHPGKSGMGAAREVEEPQQQLQQSAQLSTQPRQAILGDAKQQPSQKQHNHKGNSSIPSNGRVHIATLYTTTCSRGIAGWQDAKG